MPNRDYYLNKGAKFDTYRSAYLTYVTKIFELIGDPNPADSAKRVIALENRIAQVAWADERRRNIKDTNNPMDLAALKKYVPGVDWDVVLGGVGLGEAKDFIVNETTAIRDGARLLDTVPLADWKTYMTFHFVDSYATDLPKAFDTAQFDFRGKVLSGVEQQRDRWKRGISLVDDSIGEGLGQVYVRKHFAPDTKAKMEEMADSGAEANEAAIKLARIHSGPGTLRDYLPRGLLSRPDAGHRGGHRPGQVPSGLRAAAAGIYPCPLRRSASHWND